MSSKEFRTVHGRVTRVTRLDSCGNVLFGEDSQAVSKSFVSVAISPNTRTIDEVSQNNADGTPGVYDPAQEHFRSNSVEAVFTRVDPEFFEIVTKQRLYYDDDGMAIGFAISSDVDVYLEAFALEVWAGDVSGDCDADEARRYGYFLLPFLKGARLGEHTLQNGAVTFTLTGALTYDGNGWGSGPYRVMTVSDEPSVLNVPVAANDHELMIWVDVAPPTPFVGARPVMDPAATEITAVVAAEGSSPSEADFTFTGGSTAPVWIDFGDGEWDYIAAGSSGASHTYAANGTYQVQATSNGVWVTTSVVIPFP